MIGELGGERTSVPLLVQVYVMYMFLLRLALYDTYDRILSPNTYLLATRSLVARLLENPCPSPQAHYK